MSLPNENAELMSDHVKMVIADDDYAEAKVQNMKAVLKQNLQNLKNDAKQLKPLLDQTVSVVAERRKIEVKNEANRDNKRSFTVRNRN